MQIIITDAGATRSYSFGLSWAGAAALVLGLAGLGAAGMYVFTGHAIREGAQALETQAQAQQAQQEVMQQSMTEMAQKVGELQARLVQLQHLSDRVVELANVPKEVKAAQKKAMEAKPGQGGALVEPEPVKADEIESVLKEMDVTLRAQSDFMLFAEAQLFDLYLSREMIPTQEPVPGRRVGSPFGRRIDPFNGTSAMHTGLDFQAPTGTPIHAAAGGVVITKEYHHAYGNMVEIDHGNGLVTRYAHASELLASRGDVVKRGEVIARVGSTGRSTGPHLHFEVLLQGVHQDPMRFLNAGKTGDLSKLMVASAAPKDSAGGVAKAATTAKNKATGASKQAANKAEVDEKGGADQRVRLQLQPGKP